MLTGQFLMLAAPPAYDQDAVAWRTAVLAAGGTVTAPRMVAVSTLIQALKTAGVWTALDRLWLHAAENATQALIDLKARATATAVNSPTFTTDRGFAGNGTTSYIDSNFNASTAGGNFTQNGASMGGWCATFGASGGALIGNNDSSYSRILLLTATRESSCNSATAPTQFAVAVNTGFIMAQRTGAAVHGSWLNGVAENADTKTSTPLVNQTTKILANVLSGGTVAKFATHQTAMSFIGGSLAGKELAFYQALQAYMTTVGISSQDGDATEWARAVVAAGGSVGATRLGLVNSLVVSLKAAGVWSGLDRLWLHAAENATQALIDLKARATATAVNSPTFTADSGYQCNGTTSYLNLGLAANAGGTNYTRDDAGVGGWITSVTGSGGGMDFGHDFGGYSMIMAKAGVANTRWEINANTNPSGVPAIAFVAGLFHSQRTGPATSALFRNGASIITSTAPSIALPAKNFGVGAYVAGGPSTFNAGLYAASFIGASLGGKEAAFYAPIRTYMTAVGVP